MRCKICKSEDLVEESYCFHKRYWYWYCIECSHEHRVHLITEIKTEKSPYVETSQYG